MEQPVAGTVFWQIGLACQHNYLDFFKEDRGLMHTSEKTCTS